jgi:HK97 gp10 family phage protein
MAQLLMKLGPQVARRVGAQALRAGARPVVDRAKQLVSVDTGALRESIGAELVTRGVDPDRRVIAIGIERPVSRRMHFIEFGTAHSAAKPFMRPALDEQKENALDEMGRVLAVGIDREAAKRARS